MGPSPLFHNGAATRSRTLDLLITSELLYQLSYGGQNGCEILKNEVPQSNHPRQDNSAFSVFAGAQRDLAAGQRNDMASFLEQQGTVAIYTPNQSFSDSPPNLY